MFTSTVHMQFLETNLLFILRKCLGVYGTCHCEAVSSPVQELMVLSA